jgi:hypothetical protein
MILRNLERRVKKVLPPHDPSIEWLAAARRAHGAGACLVAAPFMNLSSAFETFGIPVLMW